MATWPRHLSCSAVAKARVTGAISAARVTRARLSVSPPHLDPSRRIRRTPADEHDSATIHIPSGASGRVQAARVRLQPPTYQRLCCPSGKSRHRLVQYPAQKYSPFVLMQISSSLCRLTRQEGRLAIVTNVRWDAVDANGTRQTSAPDAYGEVVWFGRRGAGAEVGGKCSRRTTEAKEPFSGKSTK